MLNLPSIPHPSRSPPALALTFSLCPLAVPHPIFGLSSTEETAAGKLKSWNERFTNQMCFCEEGSGGWR